MDFLLDIAEQVRPLARAELQWLKAAKRADGFPDDDFQQWDLARYKHLVRKQVVGMEPSDFAEYLSLRRVLEGIEFVVRQTFGVSMTKVPLQPGEAWTGAV